MDENLPYNYYFDPVQQHLIIDQTVNYNQTQVVAILPIPRQQVPYPGYQETFEKPENKDALERVKRLVHMANCGELAKRYLEIDY